VEHPLFFFGRKAKNAEKKKKDIFLLKSQKNGIKVIGNHIK